MDGYGGYGLGPKLRAVDLPERSISVVEVTEPGSPWKFYIQMCGTDLNKLMEDIWYVCSRWNGVCLMVGFHISLNQGHYLCNVAFIPIFRKFVIRHSLIYLLRMKFIYYVSSCMCY